MYLSCTPFKSKCDSHSVSAFRKLVLVLVKVDDVDVTVPVVLLLDVEEVVEPVQTWDTQSHRKFHLDTDQVKALHNLNISDRL